MCERWYTHDELMTAALISLTQQFIDEYEPILLQGDEAIYRTMYTREELEEELRKAKEDNQEGWEEWEASHGDTPPPKMVMEIGGMDKSGNFIPFFRKG